MKQKIKCFKFFNKLKKQRTFSWTLSALDNYFY